MAKDCVSDEPRADLDQFWAWWNVLGSKRPHHAKWINTSKGRVFEGFAHADFKQVARLL